MNNENVGRLGELLGGGTTRCPPSIAASLTTFGQQEPEQDFIMQTMTTLVGHLTDAPQLVRVSENNYVCKLRLAASRRIRRNRDDASTIAQANLEAAGYKPREQKPNQADAANQEAESESTWSDTDSLFIDVECWGQLARNVKVSLDRGRPVIVNGYLTTQSWKDKEGNPRSKTVMRAIYVGLELSRYVAGSRKSVEGNAIDVPGATAPQVLDAAAVIPDIDYVAREEAAQQTAAQNTKDTTHTKQEGQSKPARKVAAGSRLTPV